MGKQHAPGFLKLVEEAKQVVKECNVQDVKGRLDRGEGSQTGNRQQTADLRGTVIMAIMAFALVVSVLGIVATLFHHG